MLEGLKICMDNIWEQIQIEADSSILINVITRKCLTPWRIDAKIQHIPRIIQGKVIVFQHVSCECNRVADNLASIGIQALYTHRTWPNKVKGLISLDRIGCPYLHFQI
ncbi:hypothetical protein ACH5RR_029426 [Cinchona calisaya]|uniref:RNase H type-1 domain-containing protein n=1 Tax=Cinchona calisaya TaxID=153742 RepID=A0ABD2YVH0_9GENT